MSPARLADLCVSPSLIVSSVFIAPRACTHTLFQHVQTFCICWICSCPRKQTLRDCSWPMHPGFETFVIMIARIDVCVLNIQKMYENMCWSKK